MELDTLLTVLLGLLFLHCGGLLPLIHTRPIRDTSFSSLFAFRFSLFAFLNPHRANHHAPPALRGRKTDVR